MLIYLDVCFFNRAFDQQSQMLVRLQTEAKLAVQRGVRDGQLGLAWSAVLDLENAGNRDAERAEAITLSATETPAAASATLGRCPT